MGRFTACVSGALLIFATAALGQDPQPAPGSGLRFGPGPGPAEGPGAGPGPEQDFDPGPPPDVLQQGGFPPTIGVVEAVQDGKVILRHLQVKPTQEKHKVPVTKKVSIDGREEEKTEYQDQTFTRLRPMSTQFACDLADVLAFDTNGQPIPPDVLATMFPRPRMVLMTFPGFPVDPLYLKVARDGTPFLAFLTLPPPPQNQGPPPSNTGAPPSNLSPSQPPSQPSPEPPLQPKLPASEPSTTPSDGPPPPPTPGETPKSDK